MAIIYKLEVHPSVPQLIPCRANQTVGAKRCIRFAGLAVPNDCAFPTLITMDGAQPRAISTLVANGFPLTLTSPTT